MRKRFVPLAIALASLAAFGVLGVLTGGSTPSQQPAAVAPAVSAEPAAPGPETIGDASAPAAQAEEAASNPEGAVTLVTGCGKPVPCPNRDCADCPHNIYLK